MSNEPTDWTATSLGEQLSLLKDGTHGSFSRTQVGVPFLSAKNISNSGNVIFDDTDYFISERDYRAIHSTFSLVPGDLLLTIVGSLGRRALFCGERVTFQRSVAYLRSNGRILNPGYLFHLVSGTEFQRELVSRSNSTAQAGVYLGELAKIELALPPLPEQRRIAEILDTLDDQIHATEQIIEKLKLAADGFSDDSFGGLLDSEVETVPLGRLLAHLIDYRGRTPKKIGMEWGGGEILALSANNVQMGGIDPTKEAYFGSEALFARWMTNGRPMCGDILMTLEAPLGNVAQVPDDSRYILSQRVVLLRFDEEIFLNKFAYWYLQSRIFQQELVRNSTGTTASGIRRASLEKIHLPLVGLAAQHKISDVLFAFESKIAAERRDLAKLRLQKSGLMSDLLTGRIRVPLETAS